MSDPAKPPAPQPTAQNTFAIPREVFDAVPQRRARYILAYIVYVIGVFGPNFIWMSGRAVPPELIYPAYAVGACAFFVFAYNFFRTFRTMGYEIWFAIAIIIVCAPLIPGVILLAFMDRKIATVWDAADPSGGYRQRPPSDS
jgi:hypothetical protein